MNFNFTKNKYFNSILLFLIYFAIPFALYIIPAMKGNLIISGDGAAFFSFKEYVNNCISDGVMPFWCPYMQNGVPFIADQSYAPLYPVSLLLFWMPLEYFVLVYYCLHIAIAGYFMNKYVQQLECDNFVGFMVGLLFSLSICLGGYRKSHMGIISTVVWIPAVFYFIQRYVNSKSIKYLMAASIVMALQFLAGFAQIALYTDAIAGLYLLAYMLKDKMKYGDIIKHGLAWVSSYFGLICVQLLPMITIMRFYGNMGALGTTYETFKTYSISFRKLLMMVYPKIFGADVYMPYGHLYSSEMDIELFIGIAVVLICVTTIILLYRNFLVKLTVGLSAGIFVYAANAHVPFLSKVLFRLPLLNGFRVPSRILFLFVFFMFVLFALGIQYLKESNRKGAFLKIAVIVHLVFIMFACLSYIVIGAGMFTPELKQFYESSDVFIQSGVLGLIVLSVLFIYVYKNDIKWFYVFLVVLMASTIFQTFPYYKLYRPVSSDEFELTKNNSRLKDEVGKGVLWYTSEMQEAYFSSPIGFNKAITFEVPTLNCYTSLNNPNLYRLFNNNNYSYLNFSGLYTWFPIGKTNLLTQNDELSMIGVNIVADNENIVSDDGEIFKVEKNGKKTEVLAGEKVNIPNMEGQLFVYAKMIPVQSNTFYEIELEAESEGDVESLYVDFYGENYDRIAQDLKFHVKKGNDKYTGYIFSGEVPENKDVSIRVVAMPTCDTTIKGLKINKLDTVKEDGIYTKLYEEGGYTYFRNNNAKKILYLSENIENISSTDDFFGSVLVSDTSTTSFVEGVESEINLGKGNIEITDQNENSISANISLDKSGFLNFGQNYFPGWKAFIDGKETEVHVVNGLIQGVFVPEGEHSVKFEYIPKQFYLGAGISATTILIIALIIFLKKGNKPWLSSKNEV